MQKKNLKFKKKKNKRNSSTNRECDYCKKKTENIHRIKFKKKTFFVYCTYVNHF